MQRIASILVVIVSAAIAGCVSSDPWAASQLAAVGPPRADNSRTGSSTNGPTIGETEQPSTTAPRSMSSGSTRRQDDANHNPLVLNPLVYASPLPIVREPERKTASQESTREASGNSTSTDVVRLISPPSPAIAVGPLSQLWQLYRAFEFKKVIELAMLYATSAQSTGYELASAYVLSAASAYLRGDQNLARTFVRDAVQADPRALPDPDYFPGEFCRLYEGVMRSGQHGR